MIYLIDDKRIRQKSYGWDEENLKHFKDFLKPIYTADELVALKDEISSNTENIIFFHESFFDNATNFHKKNSSQIRRELEVYASNNSKRLLVMFSGSRNSRNFSENIAYIPVSVLYQNLR